MGGLGRPPPPRPTPPTPRQPRGPTRRQTQPSKAASPAALHADPRGPPAPSSAARAHPQGSRRHLVPPARRHFPPPPARRCASAPARPGRPPVPARAGPGGRGSSVRGPPRRLGEGRAPTPPAAPGRRQPRPAKGPAGPHWAERLRRRPRPEGSIALTSCFGSGHFGRTRMEAPKNTRMEEAATGESGCSWGERAQPATGNGAAAAPRPRPPSNSPHSGPPLPGGGPARRARRHFRPPRRAGRFPLSGWVAAGSDAILLASRGVRRSPPSCRWCRRGRPLLGRSLHRLSPAPPAGSLSSRSIRSGEEAAGCAGLKGP